MKLVADHITASTLQTASHLSPFLWDFTALPSEQVEGLSLPLDLSSAKWLALANKMQRRAILLFPHLGQKGSYIFLFFFSCVSLSDIKKHAQASPLVPGWPWRGKETHIRHLPSPPGVTVGNKCWLLHATEVLQFCVTKLVTYYTL